MNEGKKAQASVMELLMRALLRKRVGGTGPGGKPIHRRSRNGVAPGKWSGDDPRGSSVRAILAAGMYSRVRSGTRTGTPVHVRNWKALGHMKRAARKIPVTALNGVPSHIQMALMNHSGFDNVWDLGQANLARILDTPGVGPKMAGKIRLALLARNVPVTWKVAG